MQILKWTKMILAAAADAADNDTHDYKNTVQAIINSIANTLGCCAERDYSGYTSAYVDVWNKKDNHVCAIRITTRPAATEKNLAWSFVRSDTAEQIERGLSATIAAIKEQK